QGRRLNHAGRSAGVLDRMAVRQRDDVAGLQPRVARALVGVLAAVLERHRGHPHGVLLHVLLDLVARDGAAYRAERGHRGLAVAAAELMADDTAHHRAADHAGAAALA